jgi:hypothetical protein
MIYSLTILAYETHIQNANMIPIAQPLLTTRLQQSTILQGQAAGYGNVYNTKTSVTMC